MNISEFEWIDYILLSTGRIPITSKRAKRNNFHKQLRFVELLFSVFLAANYIYIRCSTLISVDSATGILTKVPLLNDLILLLV